MDSINCFEDLVRLGWRKRLVGRRKSYSRPPPSNAVVRQRRDLSEEERVAFGHILFPGQGGRRQALPVAPAPSLPPPSSLSASPSPASSSTPLDTAPAHSGSRASESVSLSVIQEVLTHSKSLNMVLIIAGNNNTFQERLNVYFT